MIESTEAPFEEPPGYVSAPGYVKSRAGNNQHYLRQMKDARGFEIISKYASKLDELVPGYNISQIKVKFGGLRFYIDQGSCPDELWIPRASDAYLLARQAEKEVDAL